MHTGRGAWSKAPPELATSFEAAMAELGGAQVRKMFGYPAAFLNGHLFTGLFADRWFVRLPDDARAELAARGGTPFEPMPGRPMREYLVLPDAVLADPAARRGWLERALAHAAALPPKR